MSAPVFDLERLRRNWTTPEPVPVARVDRFASAEHAIDSRAAVRALFEQLQQQCHACFPERREALEAYLARIERGLGPALDATSLDDPPRAELLELLDRLEELMEVFLRDPIR